MPGQLLSVSLLFGNVCSFKVLKLTILVAGVLKICLKDGCIVSLAEYCQVRVVRMGVLGWFSLSVWFEPRCASRWGSQKWSLLVTYGMVVLRWLFRCFPMRLLCLQNATLRPVLMEFILSTPTRGYREHILIPEECTEFHIAFKIVDNLLLDLRQATSCILELSSRVPGIFACINSSYRFRSLLGIKGRILMQSSGRSDWIVIFTHLSDFFELSRICLHSCSSSFFIGTCCHKFISNVLIVETYLACGLIRA